MTYRVCSTQLSCWLLAATIPTGLRELCEDLRIFVPGRLTDVNDALHRQDTRRLSEACAQTARFAGDFLDEGREKATTLEEQAALASSMKHTPLWNGSNAWRRSSTAPRSRTSRMKACGARAEAERPKLVRLGGSRASVNGRRGDSELARIQACFAPAWPNSPSRCPCEAGRAT